MAKFTHIHVHTEYSLLDGLSKIDQLFAKAMEYGMDSLAITDHGVMYGVIKFFLKAREFEMKPIIGIEAYVAARSRFDKQVNIDSDRYHMILLAKNETGYKNLMKLTTLAHLEGFYYKPRIDMDILKQYSEGLVATTACIDGEIPQLILQRKRRQVEDKAREMQGVFGKDFYLEIEHHPAIPEQIKVNEGLVKLSRQLGIPLVAANDVHYVNADDAEAQDALLAVQTQKMIADKKRLTMLGSPDFYLASQEEMLRNFMKYPDAIENTRKISRACNLDIPIGNWILPNYPLTEEETAEEHLRKMVYERLPVRFKNPDRETLERLEYELEIICKKGFATYFLIVQDFVNWSKREGIRVGPGRGSAAGSLVSYVLRITSVDPLRHNIPFERFMNPQRPSPPDIDLDFADDRRDEVIQYVTQKYGKDRVAQIITFNVMKAKESVRDIGRVLGMPYSEPDQIAKLIPMNMTIAEALKVVPELANYYRQPKFKKLLDLAQKVEGVSRHASTHAAGVVISDKELEEYTPLQKETKGERIITQYDMYCLDLNVSEKAIGLLKMDFLGLRNLTILEKALNYIKHIRGIGIDLSEISLEDSSALRMIASGETTGIFQLESAGMRRLARKLRPTKFSDLIAMVALYRPGPMQLIDEFLAGKRNPQQIHYIHPDLKPILEETYGVAVYQEQCMRIANVMAGYSMAEADILRRAIGKKKKAIMTREKKKFIQGARRNHYSQEIAEKVWIFIERFTGYGFNIPHSASYAMIAYQTAYLKAHYPVEFMAALLTAEAVGSSGPQKDEKISLAVRECRRMGIVVLPPDIYKSKVSFMVDDLKDSLGGKAIRFGLSAIKNVGRAAILEILSVREVGGDFKSLTDFCQRVDTQKVNKKVLESLIKAGAMDRFGKRAAMLSALDNIRARGAKIQKEKANGQTSLFGQDSQGYFSPNDELPEMEEFSRKEILSLEKDLLGFYLTDHPLTSVLSLLSKERSHKIDDLKQARQGEEVIIGGMVAGIRIVLTRKQGQEMAFVRVEDDTASIEVVVFPKIYIKSKEYISKEQVVLIKGRFEKREDRQTLIAENVALLSQAEKHDPFKRGEGEVDFELKLPARISPNRLVALNRLLKQNQGRNKIALIFVDSTGRGRRLVLPFGVDYSKELEKRIAEIINV